MSLVLLLNLIIVVPAVGGLPLTLIGSVVDRAGTCGSDDPLAFAKSRDQIQKMSAKGRNYSPR